MAELFPDDPEDVPGNGSGTAGPSTTRTSGQGGAPFADHGTSLPSRSSPTTRTGGHFDRLGHVPTLVCGSDSRTTQRSDKEAGLDAAENTAADTERPLNERPAISQELLERASLGWERFLDSMEEASHE
ncbi:hypothetical protein AB0940_16585 [Streptomyces sp. NPDC006656]|uniref:hypothetical protein n=1 Tax=Streptomyces sp. NPDC006656 TaxID=3156899 RepID=UPI0034527E00